MHRFISQMYCILSQFTTQFQIQIHSKINSFNTKLTLRNNNAKGLAFPFLLSLQQVLETKMPFSQVSNQSSHLKDSEIHEKRVQAHEAQF